MRIVQRQVDNQIKSGWMTCQKWKRKDGERRRKGVAISCEFSIGCKFYCRSPSRLSTSSLPHFLPLLLPYVLIWQLSAANRCRPGSSFKQRV